MDIKQLGSLGFEALFSDFIAEEGFVSKFKNRKVNPSNRSFMDKLKSYSSIEELLKSATFNDSWKRYEADGKYEGINVSIDTYTEPSELNPQYIKVIKMIISETGKVIKLVSESIINDYNKSNGKEGPWEWQDEPFKKRTSSDVFSKLMIETVSINIKDDVITPEYYIDDGGLYGGHVLVVSDMNDSKTGKFTSKTVEFSIEG